MCVRARVPCVIRIIHFDTVRPILVFNLTSVICVLIGAEI